MNIVGVDIGGTFTDLVGCVDGRIVTSKTSTVPADPTRGVADSLALAHCEMPALSELLHGSTIAINTVLERKGARTALITTRGFRDTYAIGRGNRIEAFNLFFHRPKPLIPRELTFEVTERMNAKGEVLKPLDESRGAGAGEDARRAEHRGGRGVLPARLCQSGARAARRRDSARGQSQAVRDAVARDRPRVPRIRAHLDHRAQRLHRPARADLSRPAGKPPARRKIRRQAQHHALERRRDVGAAGAGAAGVDDGIRPGRRHHRRGTARGADGHRARHRLRHGRHHGEGEPDHQRHPGDRGRLRDRRRSQRPADADPGRRHRRDRRGRRLDRLVRSDRRHPCRAEERGRRSRARRLRQGLDRSGGDRRQPRAGPHQRRALPQRRDEARRARRPSAPSSRSSAGRRGSA